MINKIFIVVLLLTSFLLAQNEDKPWIKAERENFVHNRELLKNMYPGDSKIDVTYYGLDLKITTSPDNLIGNVTIGVRTDTASINTCFLDLRNFLTVDSILINGSATTFNHTNNIIIINLDRTYVQDEPFTLNVFYHGLPGSSGFGGFYFGSHGGYPTISTLSESYSGPYWWPQKDTPADKADSSDIWITVDENLIPVSNGTLMSIVNNGDGTHTYHWKEKYAIAAYLISLAIAHYTQYNTAYHYSQTDSMPITHFIYPDHFNYVKPYADTTDNMIAVFSNRYGQYPFLQEKYGHAEFDWGGSMEHQTCTSMGFWGIGVVSHELAHQWYGDMITCRDWHHIWLNEGFATYSEAVYLEAINGEGAYNSQIQSEMNSAKTAQGTIWVQDITDEWEIFDGARSYSKGACVLHMLRGIVGDSTFFGIMRTYSDAPNLKYNSATTEDFQAVAESVSGQNLDYFFQEWIYGENYPKYTIGWNKTFVGGNIYQINLNISQVINNNPSYFTMPVQIRFNTSIRDTTVTLFNNAQIQNFQFQIAGNPQSIVFDPGNWILKDLQGITNTFQLTVNINNGWNIVSVPGINPDGMEISNWWSGLTGTVYEFNPGSGYTGITVTTPGKGYWMEQVGDNIYNTGDEWPAGGIEIVPHDPINVSAGWNMFGGYENSVDVMSLSTTPPDQISYPIYGFLPGTGYQTASTIEPGYGYWVKVLSDCQINFSSALAKNNNSVREYTSKDLPILQVNWGKIIITDAAGNSNTLYAVTGDSPDGGSGTDLNKYELPPLPPAGVFDVRFERNRIAEDIVTGFKAINMRGAAYPVKVRVENMNISLQDVSGKQINTNLKDGEEITITNSGIDKIMVTGQLSPAKFALEQNFPNPFNPVTTIKFSIPKEVQVNLTVYNILGEKVKELKNEVMKPGYYEVNFSANGGSASGGNASALASGVYFYKIIAGDPSTSSGQVFVQTKKMVLLK